jgi:hypothetical protein
MEKLIQEGDAARHLEEPSMRVVDTKMSKFPTRTNQEDFTPKNFTHYELNNITEPQALKAVDDLHKIFHGELPHKLSILAGYHKNNTILKVYDEFLSNLLTQAGVKV